MKKILPAILLILFFLPVLSNQVYAETETTDYRFEEIGMELEVPNDMIVLTRDLDEDDPVLAEYGIPYDTAKALFEDNDFYLLAVPADFQSEIKVTISDSDFPEGYQINDLSAPALIPRVTELYPSMGLILDNAELYDHTQTTFLNIDYHKPDTDPVQHGTQYLTVQCDKVIGVSLTSYNKEVTDEQRAMIREMVDSIHFDTIPDTQVADNSESGNGLIPYEIKDLKMSVSLPANDLVLTTNMSDEYYAALGIDQPKEELIRDLKKSNNYLVAYSNYDIYELDVKELDNEYVVDYLGFDDDTLYKLRDELITSLRSDGCTVTSSSLDSDPRIRDTENSRFIHISYADINDKYCHLYCTVHSGKEIYFIWRHFDSSAFSADEEKAFIYPVLDSITYHTMPNIYDCIPAFLASLLAVWTLVFLRKTIDLIPIVKSGMQRQNTDAGVYYENSNKTVVKRKKSVLDQLPVRMAVYFWAAYVFSIIRGHDLNILYYEERKPPSGVIPVCTVVFLLTALLISLIYIILLIVKKVNAGKDNKKERAIQSKREAEPLYVDPKDSILYLRPFRSDANNIVIEKKNGQKTYRTSLVKKSLNSFGKVRYRGEIHTNFESILCKALSDEGIPVAIGDPGEKSRKSPSAAGANRIYTSDETWKDVVESYFLNAKAIVLYVDFTEGVLWEIEQILDRYSDKVVFVPKLYNMHIGKLRFLGFFPLTAPFYYLQYYFSVKKLVFPHQRRGEQYYKQWKDTFGFSISDKVCAVTYKDGKPILHYTKDGKIDSQLYEIVNVLRSETDSTYVEDKILANIPASISRSTGLYYIDRATPNSTLAFSSNGFRVEHSIISLLLEFISVPLLASKTIVKKKFAYSDIYSVVPDYKRLAIKLVTENVNEEYCLCFPSLEDNFDFFVDFFKNGKHANYNSESAENMQIWKNLQQIESSVDRNLTISSLAYCALGILFYLFMYSGQWTGMILLLCSAVLASRLKKKQLFYIIVAILIIMFAANFRNMVFSLIYEIQNA